MVPRSEARHSIIYLKYTSRRLSFYTAGVVRLGPAVPVESRFSDNRPFRAQTGFVLSLPSVYLQFSGLYR